MPIFGRTMKRIRSPPSSFEFLSKHISKDDGGKHEQEILHFYWKREDRSGSEDLSKLLANYKSRKLFGAT